MINLRISLALGICTLVQTALAQPKTDPLLDSILSSAPYPLVRQITGEPQKYRTQIIYTRIDRDALNRPSFRNYYFNYDPYLYYNPASVVKMPLAFLSLEKLNRLNKPGVDKYTNLVFDSAYVKQVPVYRDSTSENGLPSLANYIKRAFLISENDPYNRMYQFVGQQEINDNLHKKGYPDTRIIRQFMGFSDEQNRHTNPVRFIRPDGTTIYEQPGAYNAGTFDFSREIKIGEAHMTAGDSLVREPFDFTRQNNVPLDDFRQMLQSVIFPQSVPANQKFNLTEDDRQFLLKYLSQYPSETSYPKYDDSLFYDSYVKFFFRDSTHKMPGHIRVFNKVGWSYGFLTDVSYIIDTKNNIEFMLAATVYVNKDGVVNDARYDYDQLGYPYLYQLGQTIYRHELQRPRENKPDLSAFKISYNRRDASDKRPKIREVDN